MIMAGVLCTSKGRRREAKDNARPNGALVHAVLLSVQVTTAKPVSGTRRPSEVHKIARQKRRPLVSPDDRDFSREHDTCPQASKQQWILLCAPLEAFSRRHDYCRGHSRITNSCVSMTPDRQRARHWRPCRAVWRKRISICSLLFSRRSLQLVVELYMYSRQQQW